MVILIAYANECAMRPARETMLALRDHLQPVSWIWGAARQGCLIPNPDRHMPTPRQHRIEPEIPLSQISQ